MRPSGTHDREKGREQRGRKAESAPKRWAPGEHSCPSPGRAAGSLLPTFRSCPCTKGRRARKRRKESSAPAYKCRMPAPGTGQSDQSTQRILAVFQVRGGTAQRGQLSPEPGGRGRMEVPSCPGSWCCPHHELPSTALNLAMAPCGPQGQVSSLGWGEEAKGCQSCSIIYRLCDRGQ